MATLLGGDECNGEYNLTSVSKARDISELPAKQASNEILWS